MRRIVRSALRQLVDEGDLGRVLRGAWLVLTIRIIASALSYFSIVVLARVMGAQQYGVHAFVFSWISVLAMPSSLGLAAASVRFLPEYLATRDWAMIRGLVVQALAVTIVTGLGIAVAAAVFLAALPWTVAEAYRVALVLGLLGVPVMGLIALGAQVARAFGWVGVGYAPPQLLHPVLLIAAAFGLAASGSPLLARQTVPISIAILFLAVILQTIVLVRRLAPQLRGVAPKYESRMWIRTALPLLVANSCGVAIASVDLIMVGMLLDPTRAAYYSACVRTAMLVTFFLGSIIDLAGPKMAELHSHRSRATLQRLLTGLLPWSLVPTAAVALGLWVAGGSLLSLFGPGFEAAHRALVVLAIGHFLVATVGPVSMLLTMTGHQDINARIHVVALLANIALNALLIPHLGIDGAAIATAITMVFMAVALLANVRKVLQLDPSIMALRRIGD